MAAALGVLHAGRPRWLAPLARPAVSRVPGDPSGPRQKGKWRTAVAPPIPGPAPLRRSPQPPPPEQPAAPAPAVAPSDGHGSDWPERLMTSPWLWRAVAVMCLISAVASFFLGSPVGAACFLFAAYEVKHS